jgi:hypothetical protein
MRQQNNNNNNNNSMHGVFTSWQKHTMVRTKQKDARCVDIEHTLHAKVSTMMMMMMMMTKSE